MRFADRITEDTLQDVLSRGVGGERAYVAQLGELIRRIDEVGLAQLTAEEVRSTEEALAAGLVRHLLACDTAEGYYRRVFDGLGIDGERDALSPEVFLDKLCYPVRDLVDGRAQSLRLAKGVSGGRVFQSSGTTNPEAKKKIYYDDATLVVNRELVRIGWEAASGFPSVRGSHVLVLIPEGAKVAMPFGAMVADMMDASGARVHWGADFVREPEVFDDPTFGVPTAELDFRDNVLPAKGRVVKYNLLARLSSGRHMTIGLLPNIYRMINAVGSKGAVARFFALPRPAVFAFGGGLKGMGVLPEVRAQGERALEAYLAEMAEVTGTDPARLAELDRSTSPRDRAAFDEICVAFFVSRIEEATGIRCINVYAAAEVQPCFYAAGSLRELYAEQFPRCDPERPLRDVFVPLPGAVVELRDPVSDEVIPRSELGRPGVARFWNPFNFSHLHAVESEDLLSWEEIPESAPFRPAYTEGIGFSFRGRAAGASSGGYCA